MLAVVIIRVRNLVSDLKGRTQSEDEISGSHGGEHTDDSLMAHKAL
jgi:hypothetical protein